MSNFIPIVSSSPPPMDDGGFDDWGEDDFGAFTSANDSIDLTGGKPWSDKQEEPESEPHWQGGNHSTNREGTKCDSAENGENFGDFANFENNDNDLNTLVGKNNITPSKDETSVEKKSKVGGLDIKPISGDGVDVSREICTDEASQPCSETVSRGSLTDSGLYSTDISPVPLSDISEMGDKSQTSDTDSVGDFVIEQSMTESGIACKTPDSSENTPTEENLNSDVAPSVTKMSVKKDYDETLKVSCDKTDFSEAHFDGNRDEPEETLDDIVQTEGEHSEVSCPNIDSSLQSEKQDTCSAISIPIISESSHSSDLREATVISGIPAAENSSDTQTDITDVQEQATSEPKVSSAIGSSQEGLVKTESDLTSEVEKPKISEGFKSSGTQPLSENSVQEEDFDNLVKESSDSPHFKDETTTGRENDFGDFGEFSEAVEQSVDDSHSKLTHTEIPIDENDKQVCEISVQDTVHLADQLEECNGSTSVQITKEKTEDEDDFGEFSGDAGFGDQTEVQFGTLDVGNTDDKNSSQATSVEGSVEDLTFKVQSEMFDVDSPRISSPAVVTGKEEDDDDFGDFSSGSQVSPETFLPEGESTDVESSGKSLNNEKDAFGDFSTGENVADDFGDFSTGAEEGFAAFGGASESETQDNGGDWAAFSEAPSIAEHGAAVDDDDGDWAEFGGTPDEKFQAPPSLQPQQSMSKKERVISAVVGSFIGPVTLSDLTEDEIDTCVIGDGETEQDRGSKSSLWGKMTSREDKDALLYQWSQSSWNKCLHTTLKIDTRNILIGHKKTSMPIFASSLTMLEPTKGGSKPRSEVLEPSLVDTSKPETIPDNTQDVIPPAQFDWSSSGLTNPLEASNKTLNLDFLIQDSEITVKSNALESEFLGESVSLKPTATIQPLENILANLKTSSTLKRINDNEDLGAEASRIIQSLPDLSFMHSKVLMFPIKMDQ